MNLFFIIDLSFLRFWIEFKFSDLLAFIYHLMYLVEGLRFNDFSNQKEQMITILNLFHCIVHKIKRLFEVKYPLISSYTQFEIVQ